MVGRGRRFPAGRDNEFRGWGETYMVYCPSDDMGRAWCPTDARFGVRMIRQRSPSRLHRRARLGVQASAAIWG